VACEWELESATEAVAEHDDDGANVAIILK